MADQEHEPLVTKLEIDDLFLSTEDRSAITGEAGVLVTRMSINDFIGLPPADPKEHSRVMFEIASQG